MKKIIEVRDLGFTYRQTGKAAVTSMNFSIGEGEIFGFLGPSGAGKTTTQRLIIGLLRGYSGSINVMGKERRLWSDDFFEDTGVAFDFPNLYLKLTAAENLKLIGSYYRRRACDTDALLDSVGLLPHRDQRVDSFSKGMKMRLNFIRSLMHEPRLLFFDEPTSGLDPVNAYTVREIILRQKREGKTVFLTTHNMTVAEQLCDRVAFVADGAIVLTGSPKELMVEYGSPMIKVEYLEDNNRCETIFNLDSLGTNNDFLSLIKAGRIVSVHSCEATLEDIFIKLTGRRLVCD